MNVQWLQSTHHPYLMSILEHYILIPLGLVLEYLNGFQVLAWENHCGDILGSIYNHQLLRAFWAWHCRRISAWGKWLAPSHLKVNGILCMRTHLYSHSIIDPLFLLHCQHQPLMNTVLHSRCSPHARNVIVWSYLATDEICIWTQYYADKYIMPFWGENEKQYSMLNALILYFYSSFHLQPPFCGCVGLQNCIHFIVKGLSPSLSPNPFSSPSCSNYGYTCVFCIYIATSPGACYCSRTSCITGMLW